jgi:hypothetical protein
MMHAIGLGDHRTATDPVGSARRHPIGTEVLVRSALAPAQLAERIAACAPAAFRLLGVDESAGRGRRSGVHAAGALLWRCRFERTARPDASFTLEVMGLLDAISAAGLDWVRTEHRYAAS